MKLADETTFTRVLNLDRFNVLGIEIDWFVWLGIDVEKVGVLGFGFDCCWVDIFLVFYDIIIK